jgi:hypothetical protein
MLVWRPDLLGIFLETDSADSSCKSGPSHTERPHAVAFPLQRWIGVARLVIAHAFAGSVANFICASFRRRIVGFHSMQWQRSTYSCGA